MINYFLTDCCIKINNRTVEENQSCKIIIDNKHIGWKIIVPNDEILIIKLNNFTWINVRTGKVNYSIVGKMINVKSKYMKEFLYSMIINSIKAKYSIEKIFEIYTKIIYCFADFDEVAKEYITAMKIIIFLNDFVEEKYLVNLFMFSLYRDICEIISFRLRSHL